MESKRGNAENNLPIRYFGRFSTMRTSTKPSTDAELYEEVRGIAYGSGQSFHDIMVQSLLMSFGCGRMPTNTIAAASGARPQRKAGLYRPKHGFGGVH